MTTATIKKLDSYLKELTPLYDFVKGEGYFYFSHNENSPINTPEPPDSIMVCYLNQMTIDQWKSAILSRYQDWAKINA